MQLKLKSADTPRKREFGVFMQDIFYWYQILKRHKIQGVFPFQKSVKMPKNDIYFFENFKNIEIHSLRIPRPQHHANSQENRRKCQGLLLFRRSLKISFFSIGIFTFLQIFDHFAGVETNFELSQKLNRLKKVVIEKSFLRKKNQRIQF